MYVASVYFKMFQLFQTYVVSILSGCCICCAGYTRMLQLCMFQMFQLFSNVRCKCFYLDVVYIVLVIHVCCKCMFQMFQLFQKYVAISDVLYVAVRQCPYTDMFFFRKSLYTYVARVCSKYFICFRYMLQVFHEQAQEVGACRGGPRGHNGPRLCRKQSRRGRRRMCTIATGGAKLASAAEAAMRGRAQYQHASGGQELYATMYRVIKRESPATYGHTK
jgi:hypothetical protein